MPLLEREGVPIAPPKPAAGRTDECAFRYGRAKTAADSDIVDLVDVGEGKEVMLCGSLYRDVRGPAR